MTTAETILYTLPSRTADLLRQRPALLALLVTLPPVVKLRRACEIRQCARSTMFEDAARGRVKLIKSDSSANAPVLVETLSLIVDMAQMEPVTVKPRRRKPAPAAAEHQQAS